LQVREVLFLLKWAAIIAVGLLVLLLILAWIGSKLPDVPEEEAKPVAKVKRQAAQSAGVDDRVKRRLIALCYGDQAMAYRLADCARRPGCSQQWAWEKALEDLVNDRR
jgi:hypothetical protein